ncbi:hypothetical protein Dimus_009922 [Dionaea muscipula]
MLRRLELQLSRTRSKAATNAAEPTVQPQTSRRRSTKPTEQQPTRTPRTPRPAATAFSSSSEPSNSETTSKSADYSAGSSNYNKSGASITSSRGSLSSLRDSLPENPKIYEFSEISAATNNFLSKRQNSSSSSSGSSTPSWRCTLRRKDVIIFQRKFNRPTSPSIVRQKLSLICRSHHIAVIKLIGASISGDSIYLVYEYIQGSNLAECLRPKNPSYTVLNTWMSRMQIARDLADGLNYIHNETGLDVRLVHNHIKATSVIVADPSQTAKICHFGTAELCGEPVEETESSIPVMLNEISEVSPPPKLVRSSSVRFRGTPGYMSPEFKFTGIGTQKSDVYAFGVVVLELLSGEKPMRYEYDKKTRDYVTVSLIDSARAAVDGGEGGEGMLRRWIDGRLRDSFPVEVAERMTRLALDCVHVDADKRPDMGRVASKISSLYLKSMKWADNMKLPDDFTASLAPR